MGTPPHHRQKCSEAHFGPGKRVSLRNCFLLANRATFQIEPGKKNRARLILANWSVLKWYLPDATLDILFGKSVGPMKQRRDVHGLLEAVRHSAWFMALMATFPYLLDPILKCSGIRKYMLPHSGHRRGAGKVMTVCTIAHDALENHELSELLSGSQTLINW